jgi:aspartyl-tRNA(Asn)/glutamyl-tRNA(Gln) amidotransferase subunit C
MIDDATIKKLALLSRISITDTEVEALKGDFEKILSYVEQIQGVSESAPAPAPLLKNVMREDGEPHETGKYSEALINEAPAKRDGYVEVRKIIDQG